MKYYIVIWIATPYSCAGVSNISEELVASILKIMSQ
jgi:hypothetical protein